MFAGGDCANGGREVVNAVGEGKKAARGIHRFFGESKVVGPVQSSRWGVASGPFGSGFDEPIRVPELEATMVTSKRCLLAWKTILSLSPVTLTENG